MLQIVQNSALLPSTKVLVILEDQFTIPCHCLRTLSPCPSTTVIVLALVLYNISVKSLRDKKWINRPESSEWKVSTDSRESSDDGPSEISVSARSTGRSTCPWPSSSFSWTLFEPCWNEPVPSMISVHERTEQATSQWKYFTFARQTDGYSQLKLIKIKVKVCHLYSASSELLHFWSAQHGSQGFLHCKYTMPPLALSSPGGATNEWTVIAPADEAYYSFIDPVRMKGWVGLVGWPTADGLPI